MATKSKNSSFPFPLSPEQESELYGNSEDWYGTAKNATFGDALDTVTNSENIDELLKGITIDGKTMSDTQLQDLQKQLFDIALNRKALQEQRQYDSPAAQVARFMRAGMSRDAALAAINGNGSGSGSGAEATPVSSVSPSQSALNAAQTRAADASIVFGSLSSLAGLAQVGAQIPVFMQQVRGLDLSNEIQEQVLAGNNSTNTAHQVIQSAINNGVVKGSLSEFTTNKDSIIKAIRGLAEKGYQPAKDFMLNGMQAFVDNPYTSGIAQQYYHSLADPERYVQETFNANRAAQTANEINQMNIPILAQTLINLASENEKIIQEVKSLQSEELLNRFNALRGTELLPLEKSLIRSQVGLNKAQTRKVNTDRMVSFSMIAQIKALTSLANEQSRGMRLQNNLFDKQYFSKVDLKSPTGLKFRASASDLLTINGAYNMFYSLSEALSTYGNKDFFNNRINFMLNNEEILSNYTTMQAMYSSGILNSAQNMPNFMNFNSGLGSFVNVLNWTFQPTIPASHVMSMPAMQNIDLTGKFGEAVGTAKDGALIYKFLTTPFK